MKKKYILGSMVAILLMLATTQVVFLNTVKSTPTPHDGDAVGGSFWITELDVSGDLNNIDYIGVPHVNATDDWVVWMLGEGDVTASYTVDIENNHPEYWVIFTIGVFNVDDDNDVYGYDFFQKTYNADTSYDESGTLTCDIDFTSAQQASGEQTVVCRLGAQVQINDTSEAKNFTIWAEDRSVIGIDFEWPREEPFSDFVNESNDDFEPLFSYIDGWNNPGRYSSENDMLNEQSIVMHGQEADPPNYQTYWYLGKLDLEEDWNDYWDLDASTFTKGVETKKWGATGSYVSGWACFDWEVEENWPNDRHIICIWKLKIISPDDTGRATTWNGFCWEPGDDPTQSSRSWVNVHTSHDDPDGNEDGYISIGGVIHAWTICLWKTVTFNLADVGNYRIDYADESPPGDQKVDNVQWQGKLAYTFGSYDVTYSGTTSISADISEALAQDDELLYIFAGDTGDTTVTLTV